MKSLLKSIYIIAFFTIISCKKESDKSGIKLTDSDSGKTVAIVKGEAVYITLSNPGDGGYQFNNPKYDSSILTLNSHTHKSPTNTNLTGDFGKDTWMFTSLSTGTTNVVISASRTGSVRDTIALFTILINVK